MEANAEYNRLGPGSNPARVKELEDWADAIEADILAENFEVPLQHPVTTVDFRGGHSLVPVPSHFWDAELTSGTDFIDNDDARHIVSLFTCSGCHGGETNTFFTHVTPPPAAGIAASLSGFLTGISVIDPAGRPSGSPTVRNFNDLQRRENELVALVNSSCGSIFDVAVALKTPVLQFVH